MVHEENFAFRSRRRGDDGPLSQYANYPIDPRQDHDVVVQRGLWGEGCLSRSGNSGNNLGWFVSRVYSFGRLQCKFDCNIPLFRFLLRSSGGLVSVSKSFTRTRFSSHDEGSRGIRNRPARVRTHTSVIVVELLLLGSPFHLRRGLLDLAVIPPGRGHSRRDQLLQHRRRGATE